MVNTAYLALGSNVGSAWGSTDKTLLHAICALRAAGCLVNAISRTYKSPSLVRGQPEYANLVLSVKTGLSVAALLRTAKVIEKKAGRRTRPRWSARPLDIDIIMAGSICYNWPHVRSGAVTLPHPQAHCRSFVLVPLCEIAPHWFHPGLKATATELRNRLPLHVRRAIRAVEP